MSNKFYEGFNKMTDILLLIELNQGANEAKAAARAAIATHIRAGCKTLSEYGELCGATDWLAAAEGIREKEEILISR